MYMYTLQFSLRLRHILLSVSPDNKTASQRFQRISLTSELARGRALSLVAVQSIERTHRGRHDL